MKWKRLAHLLNREVDNSPLILFRVFFGALIFLEGIGAILTGWLKETYVDPSMTFNFIGMDFLQVLLGPQMYAVYILMSLLGLAIMIGWNYRPAIILFSLLWMATYFLQKSHYNNHYYLVWLISLFLVVTPAHQYRSFDSRRSKSSISCPYWCILVFQLQIAIVYFFAAIAKIYPDWLDAIPMGLWFTWKSFDYMLWGDAFAELLDSFFRRRSVHYFMSYAGIFFDLLVIPAFLWKRTRTIALIASLLFHLMNSLFFQIGIFPYFALSFVIFFYPRETIRRIFFPRKPVFREAVYDEAHQYTFSKWHGVLLVYFAIQLLLPVRHWRIPGDVLWTEEGHRLSWRMMLRSKSGRVTFMAVNNEEGIREAVDLRAYLTPKQIRDLSYKPDMMWQFAQIVEKDYIKNRGTGDIQVYVRAKVGVNGRKLEPFTDDSVDLTSVKWKRFGHQSWLLPKPF